MLEKRLKIKENPSELKIETLAENFVSSTCKMFDLGIFDL